MCLIQDFNKLDSINENSIIDYLEIVGEYVVVPKATIVKIEGVLKRSSILADEVGRTNLRNDIKAVLPNE